MDLLPCLATPRRPKRGTSCVKATSSADVGHAQQNTSSQSKNPLSVATLRPLNDFGFGSKSIWEGGGGLGFQLRSKFRKYLAVFAFDFILVAFAPGTPVRIRGVNVGNVVHVNPSLRSIKAVVEVEDDKVIIPRNSLVEVNQSGLLMETLIDITPRDPIATPCVWPLDVGCAKEGLIACDRQKIKGYQGVSLDTLVGIFTRIGREVEEIGVANSYSLAERISAAIEEARPLLRKLSQELALKPDLEIYIALKKKGHAKS
ncbi:hypothetical protein Pfo_022436 [Paulownia fortunei]|nr:hypothetical protein Pfo_022436 [Paulownia fortunei]